MAEYPINKGVGRQVEFKGLRAQYLFLFAQISKLTTVALTTGFGVFDLSIAPVMIVGAIAGGFIGASLNKKCSEAAVEKAFNAVQLLVLAISIFNIVRNLAA